MMMVGLLIALFAIVHNVQAPPPLCDHQTTWQLDSRNVVYESRGYIVLVALMPLQCNICHAQLAKLQAIAVALREVRIVVVAPMNEDIRVVDRYKKEFPDITISKELDTNAVWQKLTARAHDHLIYDRCGRLAFTVRLPRSNIQKNEDTVKSLKSALNYARCGWCQYDPTSPKIKLTPQINAYLHHLSDPENREVTTAHANVAQPTVRNYPDQRRIQERNQEESPESISTTSNSKYVITANNDANSRDQLRDPRYQPTGHSHSVHGSRGDNIFSKSHDGTDKIKPPLSEFELRARQGGIQNLHSTQIDQLSSDLDSSISHQHERHDRYQQSNLDRQQTSFRTGDHMSKRQQGINTRSRHESRAHSDSDALDRSSSYSSPYRSDHDDEHQRHTDEEHRRSDAQKRQYAENKQSRTHQNQDHEQVISRYPQMNRNGYPTDENVEREQLAQAGTKQQWQWIPSQGWSRIQDKQDTSESSRASSGADLNQQPQFEPKHDLASSKVSEKMKPAPSLYDSEEELDYNAYESEIILPTVAPIRDQIPPPPNYSAQRPQDYSELSSVNSWPTPLPFVDLACTGFTDELCYQQLKKSGAKDLHKCCKKKIYITDVCVPGRCSNATVQICCVQKFLQAKYLCCEDETQEKTEASDSFNRCCHEKFIQEQDMCCPLDMAKFHWLSAHELCLPNVKVDLSGIQIEAKVSENQKLLVDFEENRIWDYECRYGTNSIQYFYVPEENEKPSDR